MGEPSQLEQGARGARANAPESAPQAPSSAAQALRGVGFDEGAAMLGTDSDAGQMLLRRPEAVRRGEARAGFGLGRVAQPASAPVGGGAANAGGDQVRAADPGIEPAVLGAHFGTERPAAGPAPKFLTAEELAVANRKNRLGTLVDPNWVGHLQRWLEVPVTGHLGEVTLDALAGRYPRSKGQLDSATVRAIRAEATQELEAPSSPVRAAIARELLTNPAFQAAAGQLRAPEARAKATQGKEVAAVEAATHKSWADWTGQFQTTDFLGFPVTGHPSFLTRLNAAQAYLAGRTKEVEPAVIREKLGVSDPRTIGCMMSGAGNYNLRPARGSFHTLGLAIDINKAENPWVATEAGGGRAAKGNAIFVEVTERMQELMGFGEKVDGALLKKAGAKTTEAAWHQLEESNVALRRYRALAVDPAALEKHFNELAADSPARARGLAYWQQQVANDHAELLDVKRSNYNNPTENTGFMDHQKELVVALRDVAGLGWGAIDMYGESGDVMHFDGRTLGKGQVILAEMCKRNDDGTLKVATPPTPD